MQSAVCLLLLLIIAVATVPNPVAAQSISVERVASGLNRPVFLTAPPGDFERVFILEQHTGQIRILQLASGSVSPTPFLTIPNISQGNEQGLLGLAFHPNYATNGFFYVNVTTPTTRVLRYSVSAGDSNLADPSGELQILEIDQPQGNHNGGWIGFGPDEFLYVALGDGGGANDFGTGHTSGSGNAQDLTSLLGKILRLDVDGDDFPGDASRNYAIPVSNPFVGLMGEDEIWAWGLRNPWRMSFDRMTGDLYIADVGQGTCEELNLQLARSVGGENYGWRLREGVIETPTAGIGGARPLGAIDPFLDYSHGGANGCSNPPPEFFGSSITGGYVYRGPIASLRGRYFFADFVRGRIWSTIWDLSNPSTHDGTNCTDLTDHALDPDFDPDVGTIDSIASFGEDSAANLYVIDLDGEIFRVPEPSGSASRVVAVGVVMMIGVLRRRRHGQR